MCVPIDTDDNTVRLGWAGADRAARLRIAADAYGLTRVERSELLAMIEVSITRGEQFFERKISTGNADFVNLYALLGGPDRNVRRRDWLAERHVEFAAALR
jgi:hypothetical protein